MWRAAIYLCFNFITCLAINCHTSWLQSGAVCGDDAQTYPNLCALKMADDVELAKYGFCPCAPGEDDWDPICGTDGQSYANYCDMERAKVHFQELRVGHRDLCKEFYDKKIMSGTEYNKIESWKKIMPKDLYITLVSRNISLAQGGSVPSPYLLEMMEEKKKKEKKKRKHHKKLNLNNTKKAF